ncbi:restriction endonuclease subunit S [Brachyspira aalborgi]|uniref:Restriction endonuclease subunit S n=1 Tax=Brachyspira aalborgi TaxID=29522 RepID=A0ABY3KBP3_9SPIR|nr:restriction endonuclease subunit S [Brachyspira aalborgi]TXJ34086.1 restriction endonuclease subunit S [Brachyspira aalborgi]
MNKLPSDWQIKTINEVCNIYTGNSINKKKKEENFIGLKEGLNYIGTKDISFNNIIEYENGVKIPFKDLKDFKIAKSNTSLLCIEGGSAGRKIGFTNQDVCFGNKLCCFEAIEDEPKFIYFYLQSNDFLREFNSNIQGLIGGVNKENLRKIKIPIPPLDEQRRIASALSKIDAYLENTIKLIEEKERFKRGIAKKLLTCKEGENIPEARFKGFEDEWKETQILEFVNNNIIKIEKGKSITKSKIEEGDIPVIAGGKTPPYYHNKYNYNFPCITISASGSAGYVWFHDYKIWASDCHVIYTDNKRYNIKFLYHYLKNIQDLIYYLQVGGVQKHVYAKDLIKLNIPNITIEEQEKIGGYLSLLDEEIDNLKKQKELIKEMKRGAMQKLLSGEVRLLE